MVVCGCREPLVDADSREFMNESNPMTDHCSRDLLVGAGVSVSCYSNIRTNKKASCT
jgi:hypothetical protein